MKLGLTWNQKLGDPECYYMARWVLNLGLLGSFRIHHWYRSDESRFAHDHPSDFITLILKGSYINVEYYEFFRQPRMRQEVMKPGMIRRRYAEHRHIVDVCPEGCWTFCYFWPKRRDWGFWVPRKSDGKLKFMKSNKFHLTYGHPPCD